MVSAGKCWIVQSRISRSQLYFFFVEQLRNARSVILPWRRRIKIIPFFFKNFSQRTSWVIYYTFGQSKVSQFCVVVNCTHFPRKQSTAKPNRKMWVVSVTQQTRLEWNKKNLIPCKKRGIRMILQPLHTIWHPEVQFPLFWETRAQQIYAKHWRTFPISFSFS